MGADGTRRRRRVATVVVALLAIVALTGGQVDRDEDGGDGLVADPACPGGSRVAGVDDCTHGPDPAPPGVDASQRVAPVAGLAPDAAPAVACTTPTGNRIQVAYARYEGTTDNYSTYLQSFRTWVSGVDEAFVASSAETGGQRRPMFVTDALCLPTVTRLALPAPPAGDPDGWSEIVNKLEDEGLDRADRKYLVFLDDDPFCGQGSMPNFPDVGPGHAVVGNGCWGTHTAAHELMHTLGTVRNSVPNASGGGHCVDEYDVMCYSDEPDHPTMVVRCRPDSHEQLYDCNHDDYFHTAPLPGSYLDVNWNAADSVFLERGGQSRWAYVDANQPTAASYTPTRSRQFNSSGATNTVVRTGAGAYTVRFPGMTNGGVVHATAQGTSDVNCTVLDWGPGEPSSDQLARIRCSTTTGTAADSRFTASYLRRSIRFGRAAYLHADQPQAPDYHPAAARSHNTIDTLPGANRIQRAGTGVYLVWLPGLGVAADDDALGTAIVTAAGGGAGWCRGDTPVRQGVDMLVVVSCRSGTGAPVDRQFTLTYVNELSLVGLNGGHAGYVWANQPAAASYSPSLPHQYNSRGETNTIERLGVGHYRIWFSGLKVPSGTGPGNRQGNVQVTVTEGQLQRCQVQSFTAFGDDIRADVRCTTQAGAPVDARFTATYAT